MSSTQRADSPRRPRRGRCDGARRSPSPRSRTHKGIDAGKGLRVVPHTVRSRPGLGVEQADALNGFRLRPDDLRQRLIVHHRGAGASPAHFRAAAVRQRRARHNLLQHNLHLLAQMVVKVPHGAFHAAEIGNPVVDRAAVDGTDAEHRRLQGVDAPGEDRVGAADDLSAQFIGSRTWSGRAMALFPWTSTASSVPPCRGLLNAMFRRGSRTHVDAKPASAAPFFELISTLVTAAFFSLIQTEQNPPLKEFSRPQTPRAPKAPPYGNHGRNMAAPAISEHRAFCLNVVLFS